MPCYMEIKMKNDSEAVLSEMQKVLNKTDALRIYLVEQYPELEEPNKYVTIGVVKDKDSYVFKPYTTRKVDLKKIPDEFEGINIIKEHIGKIRALKG
jgi:hypothetical protein